MAYEGARKTCVCIKSLDLVVGKKKQVIFKKGKKYSCVIRGDDKSIKSFKIYGDEFDLSCSESEFSKHFNLIYHHSEEDSI